MEIIRIPRIVRETSRAHLNRGRTIGLVPTMGALHEGHISLVRRARNENDIVVVSIFVNPTQFGPNEDFATYPRTVEKDIALLDQLGVDTVFVPPVEAMYPPGFQTSISIGSLANRLCGAFRPGHFQGVLTVVNKLFNIVQPTHAYFGQKDFQQAVVIRRMVDDLNMDIDIVVCPIVREHDGLAMSSRNVYLDQNERKAATILYKTLTHAAEMINRGDSSPEMVEQCMHEMLAQEPLVTHIQYAGVYDADTLEKVSAVFSKRTLIAIAVLLGKIRLIDNMVLELPINGKSKSGG
jgi:pantoate--beta-alanine ligase